METSDVAHLPVQICKILKKVNFDRTSISFYKILCNKKDVALRMIHYKKLPVVKTWEFSMFIYVSGKFCFGSLMF